MKRILRCRGRRATYHHLGRTWQVPAKGCGSIKLAVYQRLHNRSAFNGYRFTPSRWSGVKCLSCGRCWRTKADVHHLPDLQRSLPCR